MDYHWFLKLKYNLGTGITVFPGLTGFTTRLALVTLRFSCVALGAFLITFTWVTRTVPLWAIVAPHVIGVVSIKTLLVHVPTGTALFALCLPFRVLKFT